MSLKSILVCLSSALAVFVACCVVMLRFGHDMNAPVIVYPFILVWGASALTWPLFAVWAFMARNDR